MYEKYQEFVRVTKGETERNCTGGGNSFSGYGLKKQSVK